MATFRADSGIVLFGIVSSKSVWGVTVRMGRSKPYYYRRSEGFPGSARRRSEFLSFQGWTRLRRASSGFAELRSTRGLGQQSSCEGGGHGFWFARVGLRAEG